MIAEVDRVRVLFERGLHDLRGMCATPEQRAWLDAVIQRTDGWWLRDKRVPSWASVLTHLPRADSVHRLDGDVVRFVAPSALPAVERDQTRATLLGLSPWRKGPFELLGTEIDAEWRSDLKWRRLSSSLGSLAGECVLDVGCGNGYYAWRMLEAGAHRVVGLDPGILQLMQFMAFLQYQPEAPLTVIPLGCEVLQPDIYLFDTVCSMGVIYHRRDPLEHLRQLRYALKDGGRLVLETLVVDREGVDKLIPETRYARMRNVRCVPSIDTVLSWLRETGFSDPVCADVSVTTTAEQRSTEWMPFESLAQCLDPEDPTLTVEGYPAPVRGLFTARARP
jgi:tRNA (mo5U34)-methyltransferase